MATENRQNDEKPAPSLSERGAARRRLTRAGAGVLLTLGSRGALASAPSCLSPSGYWSNGLNPANSHYGSQQACQGGRSPGYWKQSLNAWPAGIDPTKFMFVSAFPMPNGGACAASSASASGTGGTTTTSTTTTDAGPTSYECALLCDMLSHQGFDGNNFGMHMAATFLNIQAGLIDFLTVPALRDIWNDVMSTGIYHPTAGVDWTRGDVVAYLQSTMT